MTVAEVLAVVALALVVALCVLVLIGRERRSRFRPLPPGPSAPPPPGFRRARTPAAFRGHARPAGICRVCGLAITDPKHLAHERNRT